MKKILLATDFSKNSNVALEFALEFAKIFEAKLYILHVFKNKESFTVMSKEQADQALDKLLNPYWNEKKYKGVEVETISRQSKDIVKSISAFANQKSVHLLVVGNTGATGTSELLLGSNAIELVKSTQKPVLAVPQETSFKFPEKITFASDLEELDYKSKLKPLYQFAEQFKSLLYVLHIFDKQKDFPEDKLNEGEKLQEYLAEINHQFHLKPDIDVVEGVNNFLAEKQPDLFVLVARDHNLIENLFRKSVTKSMKLHQNMPFLALHE